MSTLAAGLMFVVGLLLVVFFAEKLVEGIVGTSLGFGVSAFILSVVFIGFDPENLSVGAVGAFERAPGIALGSIVGAAMVAIALAFGITALLVPMEFRKAPPAVLVVPVLAVLLFAVLAWDGALSRLDGLVLLAAFVAAILHLLRLSRKGVDIEAGGEVAEMLEEEAEKLNRGKSIALFAVSLVAIVIGSELLVDSAQAIIGKLGISETVFGMTILALLVSIEEIARELPAAAKGRPDVSFGNVVGSILAFFLFNGGMVALVRPVQVGEKTLRFYLPMAFVTTLVVCAFVLWRRLPRWAGAVLLGLYLVFAVGGYLG